MKKIIKKMEVYDSEKKLLYIKEYNKHGKEIHHKSASILYPYNNDTGETCYKVSLGSEYWIVYNDLGSVISYKENENLQQIFNDKDKLTKIIDLAKRNNNYYNDKELLIIIKSYDYKFEEHYNSSDKISYYKYNENNDIIEIITQNEIIETRKYEYYE